MARRVRGQTQGQSVNRVLVLIPSFGDWQELPRLVAEIDRLGSEYRSLIIDDGSPRPIPKPDVVGSLLVRLPTNIGLGVSIGIAIAHAAAHGYEVLVRIDADGQHNVADIPLLVAQVRVSQAAVALGVRTNQDFDFARRLVKAYMNFVAMLLTRGAVPRDVNSGFFAINRAGIARLEGSHLERFPEPELYVSAWRVGARLLAVNVQQRPRQHGASSFGWIAAARMLFRFSMFALGQLFQRTRP